MSGSNQHLQFTDLSNVGVPPLIRLETHELQKMKKSKKKHRIQFSEVEVCFFVHFKTLFWIFLDVI
jgi:hypothetical protein